MIGWKIACTIDEKDVVAEVASQPIPETRDGWLYGYVIFVYHNGMLKPVSFSEREQIKVIEKAS